MSSQKQHVTLREPDTVIFDFLGKDSIRFYNEFKEQTFSANNILP